MKCLRCHHQNEADAKFCEACGSPLTGTCPQCQKVLSATAKFCPECGRAVFATEKASGRSSPESYTPTHLAEKILKSRSALEGERKLVTVLFCDIAGSTALAESIGPDRMH